MVLAEEVVCAFINSFLCSAPLNFTIKEVVCAVLNSFFVNPRLVLFEHAARKSLSRKLCVPSSIRFLGGAPLKVTIKEIMGAILKSFVYWILIPKKMMCSVFKSFFLLEARGLTEFLACFLRWDNTLTSPRSDYSPMETVFEVGESTKRSTAFKASCEMPGY